MNSTSRNGFSWGQVHSKLTTDLYPLIPISTFSHSLSLHMHCSQRSHGNISVSWTFYTELKIGKCHTAVIIIYDICVLLLFHKQDKQLLNYF